MSELVGAHRLDHAVGELPALSIISNSCLLRAGIPNMLLPYVAFQLSGQYAAAPFPEPDTVHPQNHIALVDTGIGHNLAIQWTCYWRTCMPPARVILIEMVDDIDVIVSSIEAGISGYTLLNATPYEVAGMILLVSKGRTICSPEVTAQLFTRLAEARRSKPASAELRLLLTAREYEVLNYVVKGHSNKEIAAKLVIELRTVKQHVHNIFAKLNLENRFQTVRVATEQGWFER
jgi:DNA-binding NarL/FixJ family response regulator